MTLLLALLLGGTPAMSAPADDRAEAAAVKAQAEQVRATSATRLRGMLGAHHKGPILGRVEVVSAIDDRHPKVQAVLQALRAAQAARLGAVWYDVKVANDTKAAPVGYYGYVVSDTTVSADLGPGDVTLGYRLGLDGSDDRKIPDYYGELDTMRGGEVRLEIGLDLLESLWTDPARTGLRQADLGIDVAEADRRLTERVVSRDAAAAWAKWVATGRILTLDEALLVIARQRQGAVEQRIGLGDLAPIERVRNRQFLAQREAELADAQGEFQAATEKLALYLRTSDGEGVRPERDRLPDRNSAPGRAASYPGDPVLTALTEHPLLVAARARLEIADLDRRLARFGLLPELRVTGAVSQDLQGGGALRDDLAPTMGVVGAKVKVPLINAKDRGKNRQADAKRDKAAADLAWLEDQVVADVNAAVAREQAALVRWRRSAESVELALQLQEAEQRRFDVGDIDLLRLWQIEQQTAKAIREEVKAWSAYQIAVADLELAVGVPLPVVGDGEPQ